MLFKGYLKQGGDLHALCKGYPKMELRVTEEGACFFLFPIVGIHR